MLLTGEPGVGKTTLARKISKCLGDDVDRVVVLDGDELRGKLWPELGYSLEDRQVATRRAGRLAVDVAGRGAYVVIAMVAPSETARQDVRELASRAGVPFKLVRMKAPTPERLARKEGVDLLSPVVYEEPVVADYVVDTAGDVDETTSVAAELITRPRHR